MQNLPQSVRALQVAIDAMPVGVSWASLADQKLLFMNRKFTDIFGYTLDDFVSIPDWVEKTYPFAEDRELVARTWGAYFSGPERDEFVVEPIEIRVRCKNGAIKTILNSGIILPETGWALATFVDISDRKNYELELQAAQRQAAENEAIYRLLLDHSPEMIILSPFDESRRYVSSAVRRITGFTPEEYLSVKPMNTFHPEDRGIAEAVLRELQSGSLEHTIRYRILHKGGGYGWVEAILTGYQESVSGQLRGYIATVRDIGQELEREAQYANDNRALTEVAAKDELTGIANRRAFNRAIEHEAAGKERGTRDLSLLIIDVDHFKRYNDLYGHLAGDVCLRTIATTLQRNARRDGDLVARFGGEEFVVLLPKTDIAAAEKVASKMLQAISALGIPHKGSPQGVVTISVGVATWRPGTPLVPDNLIEQADRALYGAKRMGRNTYVIG